MGKRAVGWFPASYVKLLESRKEDDAGASTGQAVASGGERYVALFPYTGQYEDELSFEEAAKRSEAWPQSGVISEGTRPCYVCVTNIYVFMQLRFERRASTKRNLSAIWNRYPYGFKDKVKLLTDSLCLKLFQSIYVPSALLSEQMIIIPVIVLFQYFSPNQILNFLPNLKTMIKI